MDKAQVRTLKILRDFKEYLLQTQSEWHLSQTHRDGRINSAHDEDLIVAQLRKKFDKSVFLTSDDCNISNRCWWDIWLLETNTPINIKSSAHKSADNACNFLALLWSLTDKEISKDRSPNAGKDTRQYIEALKSGKSPVKERDYWFFSVNKNNLSEIAITSVRHLKEATINCNNLPFQINWKKNLCMVERTVAEARQYHNNILKRAFEKDWRFELYETL